MAKWKQKPVKDKNPYMHPVSHGTKSEARVITSLGGRLTPASGALPHAKGDGTLDVFGEYTFRMEAKATTHKSMAVKLAWLDKIAKEAKDTARHPALTVSFVRPDGNAVPGGDWVLLPLGLFKEVFGE